MYRSLRVAASELGVHRHWLKGFCEGRRIPMLRAGRMLALSPEAYGRVVKYLAERAATAA